MDGHEKDKDSGCERNDAISFLDLLITLLKYKWLILSIVVITVGVTIASLVVSRGDTNSNAPAQAPASKDLFYTDCLIKPYSESKEMIFTLLNREHTSTQLLETTEIYSVLYPDLWDTANRKWKTSKPPSHRDMWILLRAHLLLIYTSDDLVTIGYLSDNPEIPPKIVNCYLTGLSEYFRKKDLNILKSKISMLAQQMRTEYDPLVKLNLSKEMMLLKYKELTLHDQYYGFSVIDPPGPSQELTTDQANHVKVRISEKITESMKKMGISSNFALAPTKKPNVKMVIVLMALASLTVAVALVFFAEYLKRMKEKNPEKFTLLQGYLSFGVKKQEKGPKE